MPHRFSGLDTRDDCPVYDFGDFEPIITENNSNRNLFTAPLTSAFDVGDRRDEVLIH